MLNILAFLDILDLFRSHDWTFSQIQWPGLTEDIQNSDESKTLAYSEPCDIQTPGIFWDLQYLQPSYIDNLGVYRILADLEP